MAHDSYTKCGTEEEVLLPWILVLLILASESAANASTGSRKKPSLHAVIAVPASGSSLQSL